MFSLVLASFTLDGQKIFLKIGKSNKDGYHDMIYIFEMLLCYWSWLKQKTFWKCKDHKALKNAEKAIETMLTNLKALFPRLQGSQWNIPKFHEQLHIAFNIHLFGAHNNIHTGPIEHNHIIHSKKPSKLTQKRKQKMDWQLAN